MGDRLRLSDREEEVLEKRWMKKLPDEQQNIGDNQQISIRL